MAQRVNKNSETKVINNEANQIKDEPIIEKESKPEKKVFDKEDMIPCKSITNGELLMVGNKSGNLYDWADYGDIVEVEYQDLKYEVNSSRNSYAKYPRFIVLDDDFIEQNNVLNEIYSTVYSIQDLSDLLNQSPSVIKSTVLTLPQGVQDSLKGIAATRIANGQLDSVSKIKVLDELFETDMLQLIADN